MDKNCSIVFFSNEQTRRILVGGIKGFGTKVRKCKKEGRSLWRTSEESRGSRELKSLLGRANWYKKRRVDKGADYKDDKKNGAKFAKKYKNDKSERLPHKSVMFVEQTKGESLATRLRELIDIWL